MRMRSAHTREFERMKSSVVRTVSTRRRPDLAGVKTPLQLYTFKAVHKRRVGVLAGTPNKSRTPNTVATVPLGNGLANTTQVRSRAEFSILGVASFDPGRTPACSFANAEKSAGFDFALCRE